jgi:single-strand DNA-binding protein
MFNKTLLIGNLTNDVEFAGNDDAKLRAVLNLATNTFWYVEGERQKTTNFHRVVAFGPQAQRVKDLRKGQQVFVEGRSQTRRFEQDAEARFITEVIAERIESLGGKSSKAKDEQPEFDEPDS